MRMWMVEPKIMCRRHLLGEHVECHMLLGSIVKGKYNHSEKWSKFLSPVDLHERHDALVEEMVSRGYHHKSPLAPFPDDYTPPVGDIDYDVSLGDLLSRCVECRERYLR